jgi:putative MFS transporter
MACQTTAGGVLLWRFIAGIGIGVEVITIDAYITELVPSWIRGRAFAVNQAVMFIAVPVVALLSWWLVPLSPSGVDGWRWVVLIGAAASMVIWILRSIDAGKPACGWRDRAEPTKPSKSSRTLEAAAGVTADVRPKKRPECFAPCARRGCESGFFAELFKPPYLSLVVLFAVFNLCQAFGFLRLRQLGADAAGRKRHHCHPRACNIPSSSRSPIRSRRCWPPVSPTGSSANGSSAALRWRLSGCSASRFRNSRIPYC